MPDPSNVIRIALLTTLSLSAVFSQDEAGPDPDNPATRLQSAVVEELQKFGVQDKIRVGAIVRPPRGSVDHLALISIEFLHKEGYWIEDLLRLFHALDELDPQAALSTIDLGKRDPDQPVWRPGSAALTLYAPTATPRPSSTLDHLRRLIELEKREDLAARQDAAGNLIPPRVSLHRLRLESSLVGMLPDTALLVMTTDPTFDAATAHELLEDLPACRVGQVMHSVERGGATLRAYRLFFDDEHTPPDAARFDAIIGRVLEGAGIAGIVSVTPREPAEGEASTLGLRELRFTQSWRLGDLRRVLGVIESTHPSIRIREIEVTEPERRVPGTAPQWRSVRAVIEVAAATGEKSAGGGSILPPLAAFLARFVKLNHKAPVATLDRIRADREGITWDMVLQDATDEGLLPAIQRALENIPGAQSLDLGTAKPERRRIIQGGCRIGLERAR